MFVDTAAVMEKPLAAAAGLGWQGKHTNLVSRQFGSWLFLGAIFTTLELPPDRARARSLRQLPGLPRYLPDRGISGALPARCAALHLVSHDRAQGTDPARAARRHRQSHLRLRRLSGRLPVEQVRAGNPRRETRAARRAQRARACAMRCGSTMRHSEGLFAKTPVKRTGRDRFVRNVLIAIGNSGDADASFRRPSGCSPTARRWCAAQPYGRWAGSIASGSPALHRNTAAGKPMRSCRKSGPQCCRRT